MRVFSVAMIALACAVSARAQNQADAEAMRAVVAKLDAQNRAQALKAQQEEMLEARAQEYVQLMQPLIWRELEFIRQTCELTPAQRPAIKAAAERAALSAAREIVQPQRSAEGRTVAFASQTIRNGLIQALQNSLTAEQHRCYIHEAKLRTAATKRAAIAAAVALLDSALLFTEEQRLHIAQNLEQNWQDDWEQWLNMWRYAGRYFPTIPDQHITPHLTAEQSAVWSGLQKISFNAWSGQAAREEADDAWWEGK